MQANSPFYFNVVCGKNGNVMIDPNYVENAPPKSQLNRQQRRKTLAKISQFLNLMAREIETLRISKNLQYTVAVAFYDEAYDKSGNELLKIYEKHKPNLSLVK